MKRILIIAVFLGILLAFAIPENALAQYGPEDKIVFGESYTLRSGETLDADLIVFGGSVRLEKNSVLTGDAVIFGGNVVSGGTIQGSLVSIGGNQSINGTVQGDILILGGSVFLKEQAVVGGNITSVGGEVHLDPSAQVEGEVVRGFQIPPGPSGLITLPDVPDVPMSVAPIWSGLWFIFRLFLWAALAALVALFFPNPTSRVAKTIVSQPLLSGGVGILTTIITPLFLFLIAITIILIPVSLLGILVLVFAWFFGRVAMGMEIGRRIGQMFNRDWPPGLAAGVGTFILALVVDGAGELIPCIGWLFPLLVGMLGLGAVILTRFGTQTYPPYQSVGIYAAPPVPPGPPSPELPQTTPPEPSPVEEASSEPLALN